MRKLSFVLMVLVGTMILGLPLQSYADPQLDTLLRIATQARDNLSLTISQTNNVPDEVNQLFKQGSDETDQLTKAVDQQDVQSARQHFLAAMKFFKTTNDKINSLNTTASIDQNRAEIAQLRGEISRLEKMETLLKTIAASNNIDVDFTKFDALIQTAQQDLDANNITDATTTIKNASGFLIETHNSLTSIAQERISERAKDFTEKQIQRFSKMNELNTSQNPPPNIPPPTPPTNETGINTTRSTTVPVPPPNIPPPAVPMTVSPVRNYSHMTTGQNPQEMLAELKKLVSEGKVNEALNVIKKLEEYQREKLRNTEKEIHLQSSTNIPNATENPTNNTSTTVPVPPPNIPPPTPPTNETENPTNNTSTTVPVPPPNIPPINPSITMHDDNEKHNLEKKNHDGEQHKKNNPQDSNFQHD